MGKVYKYIQPYVLFITLTVLIKFGGAMVELLIPYIMEIILDDVVPTGQLGTVFLYGGAMVLCAAVCLGLNILANHMSAYSAGQITLHLRHDLFAKLGRLSARQMDQLTVSSAESRLTSDSYNLNQFLARIQRMGIRCPTLLLGGIAMTLLMDAPLALVLIAMLPPIVLLVYMVTHTSLPLYTQQQATLDKVVRVMQENITGIRVIKALSKTQYEKDRFDSVNSQLNKIDEKAGFITSLTNPVASLILNLGLTVVVVIGAVRVNNGQILPGVIISFLQYFIMILNSLLGVTRIFVMWSKAQASALRIAAVLETPQDLLPVEAEPARETHAIEFRDVTFSYTGIGANLQNLSFTLEKGQTLGILGATGSGKTTLLNLLMRFYDPDQGSIYIDGQDIRSMDEGVLKSKFGVVFQNDFVAEGTIADNIRFFRDISEEALEKAARDAQAAEFIAQKEGCMEAQVAVRGNNLSGGQKQRLLIARALASDPEILVLDDASSALDYRTDASLRKALRQNHDRTTTVIVAQRISSIRHADLILVLGDGQVIGMGTHDTLMESCQEYRSIAAHQMGLGEEDA